MQTKSDIYEILEWDSNFWGVPIGIIKAKKLTDSIIYEINNWCYANKIRCIYFLADIHDNLTIKLAETNGFNLVDVKLTFYTTKEEQNKIEPLISSIKLRPGTLPDVPELTEIAKGSYFDTRFYFDTNFPRELCKNLYEVWITKSLNGYADFVLVAEQHDTAVGYITCDLGKNSTTARISLVGVSKRVRNQGVGGALISGAVQWFWKQGAEKIIVVTQGRNIAAQRLYQKHNFLTGRCDLWYHKWFNHE